MPALEKLPSRRRQVTETVRAAIISGEMEPGIVYSAPSLAEQFGVSATPVREAMLDLAKDGLIEVVRNKGFRVLEPSDHELDEMLELRLLLEVPTAGKVARAGAAKAKLDELRELAAATVKAAEERDFSGHVLVDIAFHVELLGLGENQQLVEVVRGLRLRSRLFGLGSPAKSDFLLRVSHEHERLVDMVVAKDGEGAEALMREHILAIRREWRREQSS